MPLWRTPPSEFLHQVHSFCFDRHAVQCLLWILLNFQHIKFLYLNCFPGDIFLKMFCVCIILLIESRSGEMNLWFSSGKPFQLAFSLFLSSVEICWSYAFWKPPVPSRFDKSSFSEAIYTMSYVSEALSLSFKDLIQPLCFLRSRNYFTHIREMIFK